VAVKLIVEREREILAFKPEEAWRVRAYVVAKGIRFPIEFLKSAGKNKKLKSLDDVEKLFATLGLSLDGVKPKTDKKGNQSMELTVPLAFLLKDIVTKDSQRSPGAPFTTSTLQQEASRKLGFGVSLTMSIAQALYQNGVITYMRTDSVNLSDFAIDACKTYIDTTFGKEYSIA
jgi:DNA topoisomerase-1